MSVRVKICGLANADDVQATAAMEPDYLGFILWPGSKRAVTPSQVGAWTRELPDSVQTVGVFIDASADEIERAIEDAGLDIVQLHGSEPPELIDRVGRPAWKAVHLDRMSAEDAARYKVDALLIDSYTREMPGGTGKTVDWDLASGFVSSAHCPVILAGGLRPENIDDAIDGLGAFFAEEVTISCL